MSHPSSETLARFVEGTLSDEERARVVAELARCAECRGVVGALARRGVDVEAIPTTAHRSVETTVLRDPMAIGTLVAGRYRVVRHVGEGGMGSVHEVEHELLGRRFALKTLHPALAARTDAVRRFLAEARALAGLGHEGIVSVVDLGHDEAGTPFLVMELLEGETLDARLERGVLDVEVAHDVGLQMAEALAVAHARRVVHRDIKPGNVFLVADASRGLRVKLLDFGIAKLLDDEGARTRTGMMLGTPHYMAPEQWSRPRDVDARADVFAWGVTLYRALVGSLPYGFGELVVDARSAPRRDVRMQRPDVAVPFADLVERCLAFDPSGRPLDASELVDALRGASVRRSWPAPRPSARPSTRGRPPPRAGLRPPSRDASRSEPGTELDSIGSASILVGRARELERVATLARPGLPPVWIVGPEGIGKTALLDGVARMLKERGVRVLRAAPDSELAHLPYATLRSTFRAVDPSHPALEPQRREDEVLLALRGLLASEQPTALLVDEAASLDARSVRLLRSLDATSVGTGRGTFVVGAERDGEGDAIATELGATTVVLGGLGEDGVRELLTLAGASSDAESVRAMLARTGGNPLFVTQCLALAKELGDDGTTKLGAPTPTGETLPEALAEAVLARLEAAPEAEAIAWQVAAVVRPRFTRGDLTALGVRDVAAAVEGLRVRDVLRRVDDEGAEGEEVLAFSAHVLAEVAYRALPEATRRELHRAAASLRARALELVDRPGRWAEVGAHLALAGELAKASDAYARAALGRATIPLVSSTSPQASVDPSEGSELRQDVAFEAAVGWSERAFTLAREAGRERADAVQLALVELESLEASGRFEAVRTAAAKLDVASLGDELGARVLLCRASSAQRSGDHAGALAAFEQAAMVARRGATPVTSARAVGRYAVSLAFAGRLDDAHDLLAEAERAVLTRAASLRADLAGWKAQLAALAGDLGERRHAYWAAVELFRETGNVRFAAFSLLNLGDTYARLGAFDEAERTLRLAHEECRALGATVMVGYAGLNLAHVLIRTGRAAEAAPWLDEVERIAAHVRDARLSRYATLYRAELELEVARAATRPPDVARVEALVPLVASPESAGHDAAFRSLALAMLARAELMRAAPVAALELARRAAQLVDDVGAVEEGEAEVRLLLADALLAVGDADEARRVVVEAARRLRDTARRVGGPVWRAHYLEDVPAHRVLLARAAS